MLICNPKIHFMPPLINIQVSNTCKLTFKSNVKVRLVHVLIKKRTPGHITVQIISFEFALLRIGSNSSCNLLAVLYF